MDWQEIVQRVRLIKEEFDRSYKCLNVDRNTKKETIEKHVKILCDKLEQIRVILNVNYNRLTNPHKAAAENFFSDIKNKIINITSKKGIEISLPETLHEEVKYIIRTTNSNFDKSGAENMAQTLIDFLNTASKLIPDFDGKAENLRAFLDSLNLVESIKGSHEATAVSLIKTKLKGNARNLLENETTIAEIISKLKGSVKGESVEVISAKIMNTRQNNKTANTYCSEIESLTKSLENAYISDGLSVELASKYSTQVAVKALTKNCTIDKVKLIMEAGQFNNMNEAISKFINSCTEATGQQNAILHFKQKYNRGNYRQYRGKINTPRSGDNIGFRPQRKPFNNYGNRPNQNNRRRFRNYIRVTETTDNGSENSTEPLR